MIHQLTQLKLPTNDLEDADIAEYPLIYHVCLVDVFLFTSRSRHVEIIFTQLIAHTSSWNPLQINNHDSIGNKLLAKKTYLSQP